jgi:hypothetical protein
MRPNLWHRDVAFAAGMLGLAMLFWLAVLPGARVPLLFHPDERVKLDEIESGDYKFFHPHLLLGSARLALWLTGVPVEDRQAAVEVGRAASALLASLAIVAFGYAGRVRGGYAAGVAVALLVAVSPLHFAYARYLKEETALALGLGLFFTTVAYWWLRPSRLSLVLLGIGCGFAAGGKYVGAIAGVCALLAVLGRAQRPTMGRRGRDAVILCLSALAVFIAINHAGFWQPRAAAGGLKFEILHVLTDHFGVQQVRPHPLVLRMVFLGAGWLVATVGIIAAATAVIRWLRLRGRVDVREDQSRNIDAQVTRRVRSDAFIVATTAVFLVAIHISALWTGRYALPVVLGLTYLAGVWLVEQGRRSRRWAAISAVLLLLMVVWNMGTGWVFHQRVVNDSRFEARAFVERELPPDAVVVHDFYAGLRDEPVISPQIQHEPFAVDHGDLETMRQMGVTHVAVSDFSYGRYFDRWRRVVDPLMWQRRDRYIELFERGVLVWEGGGGGKFDAFVDPRVRVFAIGEEAAAEPPTPERQRE